MSQFEIRNLGLTLEEAQALKAVAEARFGEVGEHLSEYDTQESERTLNKLVEKQQKNLISQEAVYELLALRDLKASKPEHMVPKVFEAKLSGEGGHFTHHESFGCMTHSVSHGNSLSFVGTPAQDGSQVILRFHTAQLEMPGRDGYKELHMRSSRSLHELALSADQFSGLMRERKASSACAIGRDGSSMMDRPPRMVATATIANEVGVKAKQIVMPLIDAAATLRAFVKSDKKISTKADYAELERLASNVQEAMDLVRAPLRNLLAETAGMMAESSTKQLMAEIAEPLKQLGMDAGDVKRLMQL